MESSKPSFIASDAASRPPAGTAPVPRVLSVIFLALAVVSGLGGGMFGAWIGTEFFLPPASCNCNNQPGPNAALELSEIRKFLGLKEDFYARVVSDDVRPALVSVYRKKTAPAQTDAFYEARDFLGGGVIITGDGWIMMPADITAPKESFVVVRNGAVYEPQAIVVDVFSNMQFVKIEAANLPVVTFGRLYDMEVGQSVLLISPKNQVSQTHIMDLHYQLLSGAENAIQDSDVFNEAALLGDAFESNMTGSVVVNVDGAVVGVLRPHAQRINAVVPMDVMAPAVSALLKRGTIERPAAGIRYTDLARTVPVNDQGFNGLKRGFYVRVKPAAQTAAGRAGVALHDIIYKIEDEEVTGQKSLALILQEYQVGSVIDLTVRRQGQELTIPIELLAQ